MIKTRLLCLFAAASAVLAFPAPQEPTESASESATVPEPSESFSESATVPEPPETFSESATVPEETASPVTLDPNDQVFPQGFEGTPQPIRGELGAPLLFSDNIEINRQNPDLLAPPSTDEGSVSNAKWPLGLSHNRLTNGGWARTQNVNDLPVATRIAGVNMRLEAGGVRELHWHTAAEWAYILEGTVVLTAVDAGGRNFVDTVTKGDIWFFPAGIPHSLQATDDNPGGAELILAFDDGEFSADLTFQLSEWMLHTPLGVLAKNFQTDISAFAHIPEEELFIFAAPVPPESEQQTPENPAGVVPNPFTYHLSQVPATPLQGGTMKLFDVSVFPAGNTIVGTEVTVEPGGIRELHWHPTQPEWSFFISGTARMTLFAGGASARTFDYQAGDVGYVPPSFGHYVENTGNTTLEFLELFNTDRVEDISLTQWLAATPPELVKLHMGFDDATMATLNKTKQFVVKVPA